MLTLVHLKHFVIVESLTIDVDAGLTCLTGETGAGKSILIDALEFVLGARGDTGLIAQDADKTEVDAEFTTDAKCDAWLEENGFEVSDSILLKRSLDRNARSRCQINGAPATATQVRALGEFLVDIHGQHEHQSLLKPAHQLALLDGFAGDADLIAKVRSHWNTWQDAKTALEEATTRRDAAQTELDRAKWTLELLNSLSPKKGEWETLSEEHTLLANSADITETAHAVLEKLTDDDTNAASLCSHAESGLRSLEKFDAAYGEYAKTLAQARSLIEDASRDIERRLDRCHFDADHFAELDNRLQSYWRLAKQLHCTPEELPALFEETQAKVASLTRNIDTEALQAAVQQAEDAYRQVAKQLSAVRQEAAKRLSDAVTEKMQQLAMQGGRLSIALPAAEPWAQGLERAEFLVSGHAGTEPRPLSKVASGGELSRVSLAISVITAKLTPVGTLIFDEVDSGIGGAVAVVLGKLLRELGKTRQVLCVTHLAQVAGCAHHQWQVKKSTTEGKTTSSLTVLSREERIEELARMLSGLAVSQAARSAAEELLAQDAA